MLAVTLLAAWFTAGGTAVAQTNGAVGWSDPQGQGAFQLAQQPGNQGAQARMLGSGSLRAAKAAQSCAAGGTILKVDARGGGYDVRVLIGSQVVVVRVDQNGQCR